MRLIKGTDNNDGSYLRGSGGEKLAERDQKGFIRYSTEELERIPPYEIRHSQPGSGGALTATGSTIAGAAIGSVFGLPGTIVGGIAGAGIGAAATEVANRASGRR